MTCQDPSPAAVRPPAGHAWLRQPGAAADPVETRYRTMFLEATDPMCLAALDGTILDVNAAFRRTFGFGSISAAIGRPVQDIYDDPSDRRALLDAMLEESIVRDRAVRLQTVSGTPRLCRVTAWVRRDEDGGAIGYQAILRPELRPESINDAPFRHAIENSQDVVSILDDRGTVLYTSPSVEQVLGHTPGERVGRRRSS